MQALFLGVGRGFKKGVVSGRPFQNTDLYNVLSELLHLPYDETRDGTMELVGNALLLSPE